MPELDSQLSVFLCSTYIECTRNLHETTRLSRYFKENDIPVVRSIDDANTVVITTCGFDQIKENHALQTIKKYVDGYADKTVVVCGCLPAIHGSVQKEFPRAIVLNSITDETIDQLIRARVPMKDVMANYLDHEASGEALIEKPAKPHANYHIQIGEGCLSHCTYCVYKNLRQGIWSKPLEKIVEEFKKGVEQGTQQVIFIAEDCASWGRDINSSLPELLRACYPHRKGHVKVSLTFMEPAQMLKIYQDLDREILENFISDICAPIQSCSQATLKAMNRRYDVKEVLKAVASIRKINPRIKLSTHIIYGFPGETREEFTRSFDLIPYFDQIIYFCYMDRPGTSSSRMKDKTSTKEMLWRTNAVQKKQNELIRLGRRCPLVLAYTNNELCQILDIGLDPISTHPHEL